MNRRHAALLAGQSYMRGVIPRVDMDKFIELDIGVHDPDAPPKMLCIWQNPRVVRPIRDVPYESKVSVVSGSLGIACYEFEPESNLTPEPATHSLYGVAFKDTGAVIKETGTHGVAVLSSLTELPAGKGMIVDAFMLRSLTPFTDPTVAVVDTLKEYSGNCRVAVKVEDTFRISHQSIFNRAEVWKSIWRALSVPFCNCGSPRMSWSRSPDTGLYCASCHEIADAA